MVVAEDVIQEGLKTEGFNGVLNRERWDRDARTLPTVNIAKAGDAPRNVYTVKDLINRAHEVGLKSVETRLLDAKLEKDEQVLNGRNGPYTVVNYNGYAIFQATVTFTDGSSFTSTGDAHSGNVNRTIAPALVRMAETRAIGRALGLALNADSNVDQEFENPTGGNDSPQESYRSAPAAPSRFARS
jgi:hypothetical protein